MRSSSLLVIACAMSALCATAWAQPESAAEVTSAGEGVPERLLHRRFSTRDGSTGGVMIEEAGSGELGSLRLQLSIDAAPTDDFTVPGTEVSRTDKALTVSWTALPMLEVYGGLRDSITTLGRPVPDTIHAARGILGAKAFATLEELWTFGGGLRFLFQNEIGHDSPLLAATSVSLHGAASADFRKKLEIPLLARFNLDYRFDNSAQVVEETERVRYQQIGDSAASTRNETRNLVSRTERFALDVSRVDRLSIGLGIEAPLAVTTDFSLHPLLEWRLSVPVNRQDYDCAIVRGRVNDGMPSNEDACLGTAGTDTWPSHLISGLRIVPPVRGVSLLFAFDLGLGGSSVFVRELAPTAPFALSFMIGYDN